MSVAFRFGGKSSFLAVSEKNVFCDMLCKSMNLEVSVLLLSSSAFFLSSQKKKKSRICEAKEWRFFRRKNTTRFLIFF